MSAVSTKLQPPHIGTKILLPRVLSQGKDGWYVTIRCEGLRSVRYGPFPSRKDAGRFYAEAIEMIDDQMRIDNQYRDPRGIFIPARRLGKVCLMAEKTVKR